MVVQVEHLIAGTLGGFTSTLILHPLDLLKVRFVVNEGKASSGRPQYPNYWQAAKAIVKSNGGFAALYQGTVPNVFAAAVSWGSYFLLYNSVKNLMTEKFHVQKLTAVHSMIAGFSAGSLTLFIANPLWVTKTRLCLQYENQQRQYRGMIDCLASILRKEGIRGWYKGFVPGLVGTSHGAFQFTAYDELKRRFGTTQKQPAQTSVRGLLEHLTFAALSKMFAAASTYPYQVVRMRLQDQHVRYDGIWDVIMKTWSGEGLFGFYKGLGVSLLRVTPATCITFLVYEETMTFFRRRQENRISA